jgi:hypothetical protein
MQNETKLPQDTAERAEVLYRRGVEIVVEAKRYSMDAWGADRWQAAAEKLLALLRDNSTLQPKDAVRYEPCTYPPCQELPAGSRHHCSKGEFGHRLPEQAQDDKIR